MRMLRCVAVVLALLVCIADGRGAEGAKDAGSPAEPRYEGADTAAVLQSMQRINPLLNDAETDEVNYAMTVFMVAGHPELTSLQQMPQSGLGEIAQILRGKTVAEVGAEGRRVAQSNPEAGKRAAEICLPLRSLLLRNSLKGAQERVAAYKTQHGGPPDFGAYPNGEQLLKRTNAKGEFGADAQFGPYLKAMPYNGFRRSSRVLAVTESAADFRKTSDVQCGFVFTGDGQLVALQPDGQRLNEAMLEKGVEQFMENNKAAARRK